ncbi:MAG: hypothetical protein QG578_151, partial [Thermodesulfobacteriota bacterium]|nr:hypothetical protein [Thermodesulfobacteriota bacterium]
DNRHGAGGGTEPVNPSISSDAVETTGYFTGLAPGWAYDWLFNTVKVYAVRLEVTRASTMNTDGRYFYTINTWIKRCNSENINDINSCSEYTGLSNTKVVYDPASPDPPTLRRIIELIPAYHSSFNKFLFGWTAAAGSQTMENLTLNNFQLYFNREPVTCGGYGIWNNLGIAGSTRYFKVNGTGCIGKLYGSQIGNIGPNGSINGYTNNTCTIVASPSEITYNQAATADADADCTVNFSGTDR